MVHKAIFTIDVEDWFHAGVMQPYLQRQNTAPMHRLADNLKWLADFLAKHEGKATFFALSSLEPVVLRQLAALALEGHEIASHGHSHTNLHLLSKTALKAELLQSRSVLEQATAAPVIGFRAPNFSITDGAIALLEEVGYTYDSSLNNVRLHKGYGRLQQHALHPKPYLIRPGLWEIPLSTYPIASWNLPVAGGAFLRHLPFPLFKQAAIQLARQGYYHFYLHPWEVDLAHPQLPGMRLLDQMRHYRNIKKVPQRLSYLAQKLRFVSIAEELSLLKLNQVPG
jgi:polysaccharide deacetylase family protein (PEP-CTERM system associated)